MRARREGTHVELGLAALRGEHVLADIYPGLRILSCAPAPVLHPHHYRHHLPRLDHAVAGWFVHPHVGHGQLRRPVGAGLEGDLNGVRLEAVGFAEGAGECGLAVGHVQSRLEGDAHRLALTRRDFANVAFGGEGETRGFS
ncbi:hypothetical protein ES703_45037 [subsurface metagenome]